jgi:homoserine kinase
VIARVPASSANLGPGFDTLGMALTLYAEVGPVDEAEPMPGGARVIDEHHPATIAHRRLGGSGPLWARCVIPAGRGMGFSGSVRVAGAALARAQHTGTVELDDDDRAAILAVTAELEGHADNVAASLYGGVTATAGGRVVQVPLGIDPTLEPTIVVWVPAFVTKTDESRRSLGAAVAFDDVVFTLGRLALLVAALAAGDTAALRSAVDDRLHQPARLADTPACRTAIDAAHDAGAWAAWLSGSGPTVAAMCPREVAAGVAEAMRVTLPDDSHTKVLGIDHRGASIVRT